MATTHIITLATNFDNAEEVKQMVLDRTGYTLYINPDDGRLHTTATAESLEVIRKAVESSTGFTLFSQPGRYNRQDNTFEIGGATVSGTDVGGDVLIKEDSAQEEEGKTEEGVGLGDDDPETPDLKILTGEEMKWHFDRGSGKWFVEYGLPGSDRTMFFEADPDQMDALFGVGGRPADFSFSSLDALASRSDSSFGGNIAEMEGTGSFEAEVMRVRTLALDEGRLPEWAKQDPAVMDALYVAAREGKSDEWLLEQISKTEGFQTRFPDIKSFQAGGNLSLQEAIIGFLEMESGVKAAMTASGFSSEAITPDVVGGLLKAGHSLDVVNKTTASFRRMQDFKPALDSFNSILEQRGIEPISTIAGMLEFVEGRASADLYDIWEASSIQESAAAAGLGDLFTAEDAMEAALAGNHTLESSTAAMQQAAKLLLRLRHEVEVGKFGLDHEELIDISLGQASRSGRSSSEIQDSINRAVLSAQGSLKKRTQAFRAFDQSGTPQAASLRRARQET